MSGQDADIIIRRMRHSDAQIIADEEVRQGWNATPDKYLMRLKDQEAGLCVALVAEYQGNPAGYINVYPDAKGGAFDGKGYPEIVDFGVLEKYRRRGIGTRLMEAAEAVAARYADTVYLGVGLHSGYGSAQRLYVRRGYVPDGSGVWYGNQPCEAYGPVPANDDSLILFLSKKLTRRGDSAEKAPVKSPGSVRRAGKEDAPAVAELAAALWPEHTAEEMAEELTSLLAEASCAVFLAEADGRTIAFAQSQLRHDYVEGTASSPVGYLEGIYVAEAYRRQGIAGALLRACEGWAREAGCREFASDCELTNEESLRFHLGLGFTEANRIICFVKPL